MKIPNYLTIGRIIIVPIFVFTYYLPGLYGDIIPFVLFVLALARLDTGRLILPFAKNSLNPEINISLVKIIIAAITS